MTPDERTEVGHYANDRAPKPTLTRAEERRLHKATGKSSDDYQDHVLFRVALGLGLREMELSALDMIDVYNDDGGARSRVELRVFKFSERVGGTQHVMVTGALRSLLARYRKWKRSRGISVERGAPLFTVRGGRRMSRRRMRERFRRWRMRANLSSQLTFHSLRHTFCQRLYDGTKDPFVVQRAARHMHLSTTTTYAQPSDDAVVAAMEEHLDG